MARLLLKDAMQYYSTQRQELGSGQKRRRVPGANLSDKSGEIFDLAFRVSRVNNNSQIFKQLSRDIWRSIEKFIWTCKES